MCLESRVIAQLFSFFEFIGGSFPARQLELLQIISMERKLTMSEVLPSTLLEH